MTKLTTREKRTVLLALNIAAASEAALADAYRPALGRGFPAPEAKRAERQAAQFRRLAAKIGGGRGSRKP